MSSTTERDRGQQRQAIFRFDGRLPQSPVKRLEALNHEARQHNSEDHGKDRVTRRGGRAAARHAGRNHLLYGRRRRIGELQSLQLGGEIRPEPSVGDRARKLGELALDAGLLRGQEGMRLGGVQIRERRGKSIGDRRGKPRVVCGRSDRDEIRIRRRRDRDPRQQITRISRVVQALRDACGDGRSLQEGRFVLQEPVGVGLGVEADDRGCPRGAHEHRRRSRIARTLMAVVVVGRHPDRSSDDRDDPPATNERLQHLPDVTVLRLHRTPPRV